MKNIRASTGTLKKKKTLPYHSTKGKKGGTQQRAWNSEPEGNKEDEKHGGRKVVARTLGNIKLPAGRFFTKDLWRKSRDVKQEKGDATSNDKKGRFLVGTGEKN